MGPLNRCPDALALLPAYVEGELSQAEKARVAGHLNICAACRREEAQYRQVFGALKAPREMPPHGDLYAAFSAKVGKLENRGMLRMRQLRWAASLGCLLLVAGVGASVARQHFMAPKPTPVVAFNPPDFKTGPINPDRALVKKTGGNSDKVVKAPETVEQNTVLPAPDAPLNSEQDNTGSPTIGSENGVQRRPVNKKRHSTRTADANTNSDGFLDVKAQNGFTARELLNSKKDAPPVDDTVAGGSPDGSRVNKPVWADNGPGQPRIVSIPGAPKVTVVVPGHEDRVQVGNTVTSVRRETGYDANGQLALIRIKSETSQVQPRPNDKVENDK
jgi:hypothetical protein